jgi:hypothetical protein
MFHGPFLIVGQRTFFTENFAMRVVPLPFRIYVYIEDFNGSEIIGIRGLRLHRMLLSRPHSFGYLEFKKEMASFNYSTIYGIGI